MIRSDGEKCIHNQSLRHFPEALLLLCFKHVRDNVADYITKNLALNEKQKQSILDQLFGSGVKEGITDSESPSLFRQSMKLFYEDIVSKYGDEGRTLVSYLQTYKESILEHHVTRYYPIPRAI